MLLYALNHQLNQEVDKMKQALVFQNNFQDFVTWLKNKI